MFHFLREVGAERKSVHLRATHLISLQSQIDTWQPSKEPLEELFGSFLKTKILCWVFHIVTWSTIRVWMPEGRKHFQFDCCAFSRKRRAIRSSANPKPQGIIPVCIELIYTCWERMNEFCTMWNLGSSLEMYSFNSRFTLKYFSFAGVESDSQVA